MIKIQQYLLKLWESILKKYSKHQLDKLKKDFQQVYYEYECYKEGYNTLLLLFLYDRYPDKLQIIKEAYNQAVIQFELGNKAIQLPITKDLGILKNILVLPKSSKNVELKDFTESVADFRKYVLYRILEEYGE